MGNQGQNKPPSDSYFFKPVMTEEKNQLQQGLLVAFIFLLLLLLLLRLLVSNGPCWAKPKDFTHGLTKLSIQPNS